MMRLNNATIRSEVIARYMQHVSKIAQVSNLYNSQCRIIGIRNFSLQVDNIKSLTMPSLSPTMTHGTISLWKSKPGDELKAGDILCEIETDKASVGFEMQDNSVLAKILVDAQGPEIACGIPIALTVDDLDDYADFLKLDPSTYQHLVGSPNSAATTCAAVVAPIVSSDSVGPSSSATQQFSPAARHMVESKSLNTSGLQGSAKRGLISKSDIILGIKAGKVKEDSIKKTFLSQDHTKSVVATTPATVANITASTTTPPVITATKSASLDVSQKPVNNRYVDIPNSNMRKVIAKRLTESKSTVPHFYTSIECEVDELMKLRKRLQSEFDVNVSVNDLVIKSAALALRDVPRVNSKWSKQNNSIDSSLSHRVDISVAVATPNGLITPIVTDADKRGLSDINSTVKDLATRARDGKLKPEEYQGGSFSISNLGMFGISSFSAVINPPQACILAVGAGITKVLPPKQLPAGAVLAGDNSKPKPRVVTTVTVQLSADRRVVDEVVAAQFLQVFQGYLSNPLTMIL